MSEGLRSGVGAYLIGADAGDGGAGFELLDEAGGVDLRVGFGEDGGESGEKRNESSEIHVEGELRQVW